MNKNIYILQKLIIFCDLTNIFYHQDKYIIWFLKAWLGCLFMALVSDNII